MESAIQVIRVGNPDEGPLRRPEVAHARQRVPRTDTIKMMRHSDIKLLPNNRYDAILVRYIFEFCRFP